MIRKTICAIAAALFLGTPLAMADCELHIAVAEIKQGDEVSKAVENQLQMRLTRAAAAAGLAGDAYSSRFFLAGRFDKGFLDVTPGPSQKFLVKTTLTVYIGDGDDQKVFASKSFELKGAGISEERAYVNAMSRLNAQNAEFKAFVEEGKKKILAYYENYAPVLLKKARSAMNQRDYDEAMYVASQIPECCPAYAEAEDLMLEAFNHRTEYEGDQLLAQAEAEWGADPTATGARKAFDLIAQIDPSASAKARAKALSKKMSNTVKEQWVFENVKKYEDALALEKEKMANDHALRMKVVDAAKSVAVARAQNQPKTIVRHYWL